MSGRARRVLAAGAAAAVLLALGWCGLTWSRASLETGSASGPVAGLVASGGERGWHVEGNAPEFVLAQAIRNSSRVDVTVTGLATDPDAPFQIDASYVPSDSQLAGVAPGTVGRPFPAQLKHGQELYVLLRYRQEHCITLVAGSSLIFDTIRVRYRLYGIGRTSALTLSRPVTVTPEALRRPPACSP